MSNWLKYSLVAILVLGLVLVRVLEDELFYDPFLAFFKSNYTKIPLPAYNEFHLFGSHLLRFALNSLLSFGIIHLLFNKRIYNQFALLVFVFGFIISCTAYWYCLRTNFSLGFNIGFTIRRVLIQPMFLILLLPAFFYHNRIKKN